MRKISIKLFAAVGALAILGVALSAPEAQARPQYLKQFIETYPSLADAAKMKKCGVCHPGKDRKMRLDYGKAIGTNLGKKNQKDEEVIVESIKKAEEAKNGDGKTFGELIKDGKLPE